MAISFPASPSNGDIYTYNGAKYVYDGVKWVSGGQNNYIVQGEDATLGVTATGDLSSATVTTTGNATIGGDLSAAAGTFSGILKTTAAFRVGEWSNDRTTSINLGTIQTRRDNDDNIFVGYKGGDADANQTIEIRSDGAVRIGGTLPASPNITLNANGSANFAGGTLASPGVFVQKNNSTGTNACFSAQQDANAGSFFVGRNGFSGAVTINLDAAGNVNYAGALIPTSDATLKENIVDANPQWDDIKSIRLRNYTWIDAPEKGQMLGVIAQEVEKVSPGLISENEKGIKGFKLDPLVMKMLGALQEAQARIEALEARLSTLEGN